MGKRGLGGDLGDRSTGRTTREGVGGKLDRVLETFSYVV